MLINFEGIRRHIPDFLIIGAAKSGTTSLYYYLGQHPDLYFPPESKEPGYFCFAGMKRPILQTGLPDMWQTAVVDLDTYTALFGRAPRSALLGEATPEYLLFPKRTINNIEQTYGDRVARLRFIVILRNPVERIWSHYWMMLRDGYENLSFAEATSPQTISARLSAGWHPAYDYIGYGMYGQQLSEYFNHFGASRIAVVLFDEFQSDAANVCTSLFRFLGVDDTFRPEVSVQYNYSGIPRYPNLHRWLFTREHFVKHLARWLLPNSRLQRIKSKIMRWNCRKMALPPDVRTRLIDLYSHDITDLSRLIGRNLSHWLDAQPSVTP